MCLVISGYAISILNSNNVDIEGNRYIEMPDMSLKAIDDETPEEQSGWIGREGGV